MTTVTTLDLPKWEAFQDASYYNLWCVRLVGDRKFGQGFHLTKGDEAKALARLLEHHMVSNYGI